jgi:hypothetical protein
VLPDVAALGAAPAADAGEQLLGGQSEPAAGPSGSGDGQAGPRGSGGPKLTLSLEPNFEAGESGDPGDSRVWSCRPLQAPAPCGSSA